MHYHEIGITKARKIKTLAPILDARPPGSIVVRCWKNFKNSKIQTSGSKQNKLLLVTATMSIISRMNVRRSDNACTKNGECMMLICKRWKSSASVFEKRSAHDQNEVRFFSHKHTNCSSGISCPFEMMHYLYICKRCAIVLFSLFDSCIFTIGNDNVLLQWLLWFH